MIYILGPNDAPPSGILTIDTTSKSGTYGRQLSPFLLGPVVLYDNHTSVTMENAWQYSKVYDIHTDDENNPSSEYWKWATAGWSSYRAKRYPMGKGVTPLYSYWDGERLGYIEARKKIYIPLYVQAVTKTLEFKILQKKAARDSIALWDYDGYRHDLLKMSLNDVVHNPDRKMGHAFVLKMLLTGVIDY